MFMIDSDSDQYSVSVLSVHGRGSPIDVTNHILGLPLSWALGDHGTVVLDYVAVRRFIIPTSRGKRQGPVQAFMTRSEETEVIMYPTTIARKGDMFNES